MTRLGRLQSRPAANLKTNTGLDAAPANMDALKKGLCLGALKPWQEALRFFNTLFFSTV